MRFSIRFGDCAADDPEINEINPYVLHYRVSCTYVATAKPSAFKMENPNLSSFNAKIPAG
jgi:hypothetical protein